MILLCKANVIWDASFDAKDSIYRLLLATTDPGRVLYMAVSGATYRGVLADQFGQLVVSGLNLYVVVFDEKQARIVQWIG